MNEKFENIYNMYVGDIYKLAYSYVVNRQDAEDITQKTFYKLYNNRKIMNECEKIKGWLIRVCVNECKDYLKSSWFKVSRELPDIKKESSESALFISLREMDPKYRLPLYFYYYEGYSIKEIAKIMNKSESAIKMRLLRAKEKLREEIEI